MRRGGRHSRGLLSGASVRTLERGACGASSRGEVRAAAQVSPRLDDGCGLGGWRNGLLFDPFKKYGEWSYMDIMMDPLIAALHGAVRADTKVPPRRTGLVCRRSRSFPQRFHMYEPEKATRGLAQS